MVDASQVSRWLGMLKQGTLAPGDLEQALHRLKREGRSPVQRLLYLQTNTTDLESPVVGMAMVEEAVIYDGPDDPDDWPYQTVPVATGRPILTSASRGS